MSEFIQDIRYGARQLIKNPGITVAAILCIALGIGANTATFSFANSILMFEPPVREADNLIRMFIGWDSGLDYGSWSYPDLVDFRDRSDVLDGLVGERPHPLHLSYEGENERVWGMIVTGNYFSELGIDLGMGRGFNPDEYNARGESPVVVISHDMWQTRMGSDPEILGKTIVLNRLAFTVIGVTQEGFHGTHVGFAPDLWATFMMAEALMPGNRVLDARGNHGIQFVTGRLKPGVTRDQARESLNALMTQLTEEYPDTNTGKSIIVYSESEGNLHPMVRDAFVGFIAAMFLVVGLILILACANVAGLLLARSAAREREIGIRLSLGASRSRLIRQLLTESTLLALLAGGTGLLMSFWLVRLVATMEPPSDLPMSWDVAIDMRVLTFTCLATVLTGILFGLVPALQATRQNLVDALKEGTSVAARRSSLTRWALVVCQVALSLVLLIGSALAVRGLQAAGDIDPGFEPDNLLIASVDLDLQGYDEDRGLQFHQQLRERLSATPGVVSVGYGDSIPLNLGSNSSGVVPEGYEVAEGSAPPIVDRNMVDHGYFEAMGIPILRGRSFRESDNDEAPPVMLVNEAFAERFWPGDNPIGKQVRTWSDDFEVIGVVPTGKYISLGEDPRPYYYMSMNRFYSGAFFIHVRTAGDPGAMLETLRRQVQELDASLPVSSLQTMHEALGIAFLPARLAATVVTGFAVLALTLAAIGLYGVIAYSVSQGTREIGIRMALGAEATDVLKLVVRQGMVLTAIGLALGVFGGYALAQLMAMLLYGIRPTDVIAFIVASLILAAIALIATYLPARRATRIDPMIALRVD